MDFLDAIETVLAAAYSCRDCSDCQTWYEKNEVEELDKAMEYVNNWIDEKRKEKKD